MSAKFPRGGEQTHSQPSVYNDLIGFGYDLSDTQDGLKCWPMGFIFSGKHPLLTSIQASDPGPMGPLVCFSPQLILQTGSNGVSHCLLCCPCTKHGTRLSVRSCPPSDILSRWSSTCTLCKRAASVFARLRMHRLV